VPGRGRCKFETLSTFIETRGYESPCVETLNRCSTKRSIHKVSSSLALSRAFEAAFIAQTAVRPITKALQNGFKIVGQPGRMAKEANDGDAWLNSIDSARATRPLDYTNPKTNQRVPAPSFNATSVIPTRAPKTKLINPATAGLENRKTMKVGDDKATRRL
jgi:hypothetical protein